MTEKYYAHSFPERPPSQWQPLSDHLMNVAAMARKFASVFDAGDWGYLMGLWHDLGKYSMEFQQYLAKSPLWDFHREELEEQENAKGKKSSSRVDHSTAGAQHAIEAMKLAGAGAQHEIEALKLAGHMLAFGLAGHHGGLPDAIKEYTCLDKRLKKQIYTWQHGLEEIPATYSMNPDDWLKRCMSRGERRERAFSSAFFIRMLFSCLVDADFLDTESFMNPEQASKRPRWPEDMLARMLESLDGYMKQLGGDDIPVNQQRARVRRWCLEAADKRPGLFSLTVPTGGGKTLSSLAFALKHALVHGLHRIVYVVPFTSIIEQNADVFRQVFRPLVRMGLPDPVVEHHSAIDAERETLQNRLVSENWDAPLIVTTSVQFYESLFANRSSQCRKLHNLAKAVIVLDEVQKLPVDFLRPCLLALRELCESYGSTIVLCTATQPSLCWRQDFPIGLENIHEIIDDKEGLYSELKRVEVKNLGKLSDDELAFGLREHEQVLCIVNTRRHARELYERLKDTPGVIHLSAAMCPAHRSITIERIKNLLESGEPCRLIATQLVEAGVDLDFPVVYRSLAGIDSIAQAAGRCNRNGRLPMAATYVFESEHRDKEGFLGDTQSIALQLLGNETSGPLHDDILSLDAVEHYFSLYFWQRKEYWDKEKILLEMNLDGSNKDLPFLLNFKTIANRFRIIRQEGAPVFIPWGDEGRKLERELRNFFHAPGVDFLRRAQRFTVEIPKRIWNRHEGRSIEILYDRYPLLVSPELHYHDELGLVLEREEFPAESFMI